MRIAPNRVKNPLGLPEFEENIKFARVTTDEGEVVTLVFTTEFAFAKAPSTIICGTALFNPWDGTPNRGIGRAEALARLTNYLKFGIVKRHKDGRSADHFVIELDAAELNLKDWKQKVAELVVSHTWIGKE